jgi:hypothetical protein
MRNILIVAALVMMVFVPMVSAAAPAVNASTVTRNARAAALADCQREAKAKMFANRTIQRRNFLKNCMIDRMYYGGIN